MKDRTMLMALFADLCDFYFTSTQPQLCPHSKRMHSNAPVSYTHLDVYKRQNANLV